MKRVFAFSVVLSITPVLFSAPPKVEVETEVKSVGDYTTIIPKTDAKCISYVGMSGVEPFPSQLLKDGKIFVLPTRGLPSGKYRFVGIATLNDEHTRFEFFVVVGNDPVTPIIPPQPADKYGFIKVSKEGAAKVNDTEANKQALAKAQKQHASAVAAGAYGDDAAKILAGWREANKVVNASTWAEWGKVVSAHMGKQYNDKVIVTRAQWSEVFNEIAEGLIVSN